MTVTALIVVDLIAWPYHALASTPTEQALEDHDWDEDATGVAADLIARCRELNVPVGHIYTVRTADAGSHCAMPACSAEFAPVGREPAVASGDVADKVVLERLWKQLGCPNEVLLAGSDLADTIAPLARALDGALTDVSIAVVGDACVADQARWTEGVNRVLEVASMRSAERATELLRRREAPAVDIAPPCEGEAGQIAA